MPAPILHVIPFLWSGAGGVVTRLCEGQARRGPVAIVTAGRSATMHDWPTYRRRLTRAGVRHHAIDFFDRDSATFWRGVDRLAALIRRVRPRVLHAHAGVPTAAAVMARDLAGFDVPVIGQMYSWGPNRPGWMNTQDMWGFAHADRVVCSAHAYRNLLVEHGVATRRLVYLPWGLPLDELPFRAVMPRRSTLGPVLGFVGRIEARKGQLELVHLLARMRRRLPDARLELVGPVADAEYGEAVSAAIRDHGLDTVVTRHGRVPRVLPILQRWDAFVSLSADEGQGMAVLEAMAAGVPVMARRVPGLEDFLTDGRTGIALPAARMAAARTIAARLSDARRLAALAGRARRLVERRYAWEPMLAAFADLYASTASRRGA